MPASKWTYGDAWEQFPIVAGETWGLPHQRGRVAVHDIYEPLPAFMFEADMLFVDPPWNLGNLKSFYTKAGRVDHPQSFGKFATVIFRHIQAIAPLTCYLEIGNEAVDDWQKRLATIYPHVQRWPVVYYRKHPTNLLRGSSIGPVPFDYTGMDEAKCIYRAAELEGTCIGDLCMGRGLVGRAAYAAGKRFVGTELNPRRLACLLQALAQQGAEVTRL